MQKVLYDQLIFEMNRHTGGGQNGISFSRRNRAGSCVNIGTIKLPSCGAEVLKTFLDLRRFVNDRL
jgi:hypothetical protein